LQSKPQTQSEERGGDLPPMGYNTMSAYSEFPVEEFRDKELLLAALRAMGFNPTCDAAMSDYWNEYRGQSPVADILIPESQLTGTYDDIGFKLQANGSYAAVIGDMDRRKGFNNSWLDRIKGNYLEAGVLRQAKRAGLIPVSRKVSNGKVTLVYQRA
jgi:hypothetical protein